MSTAIITQTSGQLDKGNTKNISNSHFISCNGFKGSAIYSEYDHVIIQSCYFKNISCNFGTIFLSHSTTSNISNCFFIENQAKSLSAGLLIDTSVESKNVKNSICHCNFSQQVSNMVSAIDIWGGTNYVSYCQVSNSCSTFRAASIRIHNELIKLQLQYLTFTNLTSPKDGVALSLTPSKICFSLNHCYFFKLHCNETKNFAICVDSRSTVEINDVKGDEPNFLFNVNLSQLLKKKQ